MRTRANWKRRIRERYAIRFVPPARLQRLVGGDGVLWTTRCCETKRCEAGTPQEMYDSYITRHFYRFVLHHHLPFAIISDKFGLHFWDEELSHYDIHPGALSAEQRATLGDVIRGKALRRGFSTLVFYNNAPLMSTPYFEMLSHSGLDVLFTTRLHARNGGGILARPRRGRPCAAEWDLKIRRE